MVKVARIGLGFVALIAFCGAAPVQTSVSEVTALRLENAFSRAYVAQMARDQAVAAFNAEYAAFDAAKKKAVEDEKLPAGTDFDVTVSSVRIIPPAPKAEAQPSKK